MNAPARIRYTVTDVNAMDRAVNLDGLTARGGARLDGPPPDAGGPGWTRGGRDGHRRALRRQERVRSARYSQGVKVTGAQTILFIAGQVASTTRARPPAGRLRGAGALGVPGAQGPGRGGRRHHAEHRQAHHLPHRHPLPLRAHPGPRGVLRHEVPPTPRSPSPPSAARSGSSRSRRSPCYSRPTGPRHIYIPRKRKAMKLYDKALVTVDQMGNELTRDRIREFCS